jgi:hypothetical protein
MPVREVLYFTEDEYYAQGESYLDFLFRNVRDEKRLGGVDVALLFLHHMAKRIYAYNPEMKIVAMLRNPVERAYSSYCHAKRFGWETCETFEEALAKEGERINGPPKEQAKSHLAHGHYSEHLAHYMEVFGRDNMRIIISEQFTTSPESVFKETLEWLRVDTNMEGIDLSRRVNEGGVPIWKGQRFLFSHDLWIVRAVRKSLSAAIRERLFQFLMRPLVVLNTKRGFKYPPLKAETRERLIEYFKPWNQRLGILLDMDFSHWNK